METTGRMLLGTEIGAALTALDALQPDVIGLNCATGPAEMNEHLRHLSPARPHADLVPAQRRACRRSSTARCTTTSRPTQLAEYHDRFVTELGVHIVGGCCGTTPEHLAPVVDALRATSTPAPRAARATSRAPRRSTRTSRSTRTPSFLIIGERTNANGSKKFRDAMLDGDWDTCVADGHASR